MAKQRNDGPSKKYSRAAQGKDRPRIVQAAIANETPLRKKQQNVVSKFNDLTIPA